MTPGQRGEAVRDLQRRLGAAGYHVMALTPATYCDRTESAVQSFQTDRGLRPTGICDRDTWRAIVEATWSLGERLLMLVAPNMRGDDVATLQATLALIGFDPGRPDGIFGPTTAQALRDFQQNVGVTADGVCGTDTVLALHVSTRQTGTGPGVRAVRELENLRANARSMSELRLVIGQFGGLSALVRQLVRSLRQRGATVVASDEPEAAVQAAMANRFHATVYVGFEVYDDERTAVQYYSSPTYVSVAGCQLAELLSDELGQRDSGLDSIAAGMRLQVLRETRMPAVLVSFGGTAQAPIDRTPQVVAAVIAALQSWVNEHHG